MHYSYLYAILCGLLYYPLQQLIFFVRFQRFNDAFTTGDLLFPAAGMLAFIMHFYLLNNTQQPGARTFLWVIFVIVSLPLSLAGSLGGGLFGPIGIVAFGILPVLIVQLIGKGVSMLIWKK